MEDKVPMQPFIDEYGEERGKEVYYATLTKRAKNESVLDPYERLSLIKESLSVLTENIFSSSVKKDQGRGVEKATGHAVELDMSKPNTHAKVKMAQDSKVVKGLITKGFTHAESSEGGDKVKLYFAGPRQRNTWLKKWRSLDIKDSPK